MEWTHSKHLVRKLEREVEGAEVAEGFLNLALQQAELASRALAAIVRSGKTKPYQIATAHYQGTAREVRETVKRLRKAHKQVQSHIKLRQYRLMWARRTISGQ